MADKPKPRGWRKKSDFHPGGEKEKLHRELGIPTDEKIPAGRLAAATRSDNPEIRRDAIRARTMKGWDHSGGEKKKHRLYDHPRSAR